MEEFSVWQLILGLIIGISLSASCGFRVFTPLLIVSIAVHFFGAHVNPSLQWIGSWFALIALGTATVVETVAYYIPWVDNALDVISAPLALVAGTLIMSGMLPEMNGALKWSIAIIAGTGSAGITQATTTIVRGASSVTTAGIGNNLVASFENIMAIVLPILAFVIPVIAIIVCTIILIFLTVVAIMVYRRKRKKRAKEQAAAAAAAA